MTQARQQSERFTVFRITAANPSDRWRVLSGDYATQAEAEQVIAFHSSIKGSTFADVECLIVRVDVEIVRIERDSVACIVPPRAKDETT